MSRPDDKYGYGRDIPGYRSSDETSRQRQNVHPQSRIPRPGFATPDHVRGQPTGASPGWSPRRAPAPQQQPYDPPSGQTWQDLGDVYSGSAYDYQEDYGQNDQWPLSEPSPARPMRDSTNSPRRIPQRPQRPDEVPQRSDYSQGMRAPQSRHPPVSLQGRQNNQAHPISHHGNGQWTGDGYSYAPPPNYPLPNRPVPSAPSVHMEDLSAVLQYAPQQMAHRIQENNRPPLGPPPSARRGPPSYYPRVGPVLPIQEETDSMRGSTRTGSAHTGGHDSKTSFASSNAIPIGISQSHLDHAREAIHQPVQRPAPLCNTDDDDHDESLTESAIARGEISTPEPARVREHPSPEQGNVRQASLGKRSKPTLTTVRGSEHVRKSSSDSRVALTSLPNQHDSATDPFPSIMSDTQRANRSRDLAREMLEGQSQTGESYEKPKQGDQPSIITEAAVATATAEVQESPVLQQQSTVKQMPSDVFRSGTGLLDPSSESDDTDHHHQQPPSKQLPGVELLDQLHPQRTKPRSPLAPAIDPRLKSTIGSVEKGDALNAEEARELKHPMGGLSDRAGRRRPPRLNVDAVKEAEARGSLTSLPDLIRRATKLASNLDRGKTASRMGMNWFDGADADEKKRRSGMSDILAAFPPPAESRNTFRRSLAAWSTRTRHSTQRSDSDARAIQRRRRCGMSSWTFSCLLLLLLLLVAAAVIVPVVLVVIPKQENTDSTKVGSCVAKMTCENGGTDIMSSNGSCECLCINGYTGSTCTTYKGSGCTLIAAGPSENATVGEEIPRLLTRAINDFSIPLDSRELLGLFSRLDMNCNVQNQLVTFSGLSRKRSLHLSVTRQPVEAGFHRQLEMTNAQTGTSSDMASPTTVSPSTLETTASETAAKTNSSSLDFARVAVLYVFQMSQDLQVAADAQEHLQVYISSADGSDVQPGSSGNVTLGSNYSVDLDSFTLGLSNGTTIGATGGR